MEIDTFLKRVSRYCSQSGMSEARLSTILFGGGRSIARLREGRDVTTRVLSRAIVRLAALESAREDKDRAA